MINKINTTIIQYSAGLDKEKNLAEVSDLIDKAVNQVTGENKAFPHLIALPEVFNFYAFAIQGSPEERQKAAIDNSESIENGQTLEWAKQIAQKYNVYLLAGSILEYNAELPAKPFNTSFVVSPEGELLVKYRKINLFELSASQSDQEIIEAKHRSHGHELATFEIKECACKVGLAICFDLRFPEIFMAYRSTGCQMIVLPSAFLTTTGQYHWETLCKARAIENQVFFVGTNQGEQSRCYGNSMIISPWGDKLASAGMEDEAIVQTVVDLEDVNEIRSKISMTRKTRLRRITDYQHVDW